MKVLIGNLEVVKLMLKCIIILFVLFIFVISDLKSQNCIKHMNVIYYGTSQFENFEVQAKIKKEDAWEIHQVYCLENKIESGTLFFVIDGYYVFSPYYNPKVPEVYLTGVYVDSESGIVNYIKSKKKLKSKSQFGWRSNRLKDQEF